MALQLTPEARAVALDPARTLTDRLCAAGYEHRAPEPGESRSRDARTVTRDGVPVFAGDCSEVTAWLCAQVQATEGAP